MIQTPKLSPTCSRFVSLLPNFSWANAKDLWSNMIAREQYHSRNPLMMSRHPNLQPRMRSILLNWLSEVSEVYQLHRETYYLAMDYFDRYLSIQNEINKQQLQLVGITCLFIASKIEEIYPPKVSDFAYVTDGACTEKQILTKELVILKSLKWNLNSMTVNSWLTVYMQLHTIFEKEKLRFNLRTSLDQSKNQQQNDKSRCLDRTSPNKNQQPPKKRKRTSLITNSRIDSTPVNAPLVALQVADTNKQMILTNCSNRKEILKVDSSDDEKSCTNSSNNNLNNITNKRSSQQNQLSSQQTNEAIKSKRDESNSKQTSIRSFISSNLKLGKDHDEDEFMYQKYDSFFYAQIAHLVDLSMLDIDSLKFSYNVIAASALYHFTNMSTVMQCTGKLMFFSFFFSIYHMIFYSNILF